VILANLVQGMICVKEFDVKTKEETNSKTIKKKREVGRSEHYGR
jgi:hypothetical protein